MNSAQLIVIGGGASGMVASIAAARAGVKVMMIEKRERAGRKIMITGRGRCNLTNAKRWQEFSTHIYPNREFLKHAFYSFSNESLVEFFKELGVETIVERGDRVFPLSQKSVTIVDALINEMNRVGIRQLYSASVSALKIEDNIVKGVEVDGNLYSCDAVVIATGGLSYPSTGSTGDGYEFAQKAGHTITPLFPSLTALMPKNYLKGVAGLTLKNIGLKLFVVDDLVQEERGDIEFTNNGIEGSLGFRLSRRAVKAMINGNRCLLTLDLKPAIGYDELAERISKEQYRGWEANLKEILRAYLPFNLIPYFMKDNNLPIKVEDVRANKPFPNFLAHLLKSWEMEILSFTSYERAVVTAGGVSLNEVYSKTMRSKLIDNLYFAGEVLDLDGDSGGYNLQIAFSTGHKAGEEAAYLILRSNT